jgi:hypothetical protein
MKVLSSTFISLCLLFEEFHVRFVRKNSFYAEEEFRTALTMVIPSQKNIFLRDSNMMPITALNSMSLAKVLSLMYLCLAIVFSPLILFMVSMDGIGLTEGIFVVVFFVVFYWISGAIAGFLIGTI